MKATFLGTGDPLGMPVIGCECKYCKYSNRLRPSLLVESGRQRIVFDISPDIKRQLIGAGEKISTFFVTHAHFDHFFGIGELFQLTYLKDKPEFKIFMNQSTAEYLESTFPWMKLPVRIFDDRVVYKFNGLKITPFTVEHSSTMETSGFVVEEGRKKLVYMPDFRNVTKSVSVLIKDADILVTDGQYVFGKYIDDDDHIDGKGVLDLINSTLPKKTFLFALSEHFYGMSHEEMQNKLPKGVFIPKDMESVEF